MKKIHEKAVVSMKRIRLIRRAKGTIYDYKNKNNYSWFICDAERHRISRLIYKFLITEIKDGVPYIIIRIRKINHDGTLSQDCWVNYDSDIIEVLSEEQIVTLGKIAIDNQIEDCVEKLKLIRATIRDHKKSKNHIKENLQKSLSQYRQNSTSKV